MSTQESKLTAGDIEQYTVKSLWEDRKQNVGSSYNSERGLKQLLAELSELPRVTGELMGELFPPPVLGFACVHSGFREVVPITNKLFTASHSKVFASERTEQNQFASRSTVSSGAVVG